MIVKETLEFFFWRKSNCLEKKFWPEKLNLILTVTKLTKAMSSTFLYISKWKSNGKNIVAGKWCIYAATSICAFIQLLKLQTVTLHYIPEIHCSNCAILSIMCVMFFGNQLLMIIRDDRNYALLSSLHFH